MIRAKHIGWQLLAFFLVFNAHAAFAQNVRQSVSYSFEMGPDRSVQYVQHIETTPLNGGGLQSFSQFRVSVSAGQTVDVLEAYTRKSDGRVIPVDRSQIATQDGSIGLTVSLTDVKIKQIPFPDLAIGDTWVLTLKFAEKDHYIPGHFSWLDYIAPDVVDLHLDYKFSAPASVPIYHAERDFAYDEKRVNGKILRHWSGSFYIPRTVEKNVTSLLSIVPYMQFSTFESYESLGRAYYEAAAPKAKVTPAIQKLAEEITAGQHGVQAQAKAIFDWVSQNVQYVAVYFGSGRYVPNEAEDVLKRRFGDCKDHVTLMSALLAAKGIASEDVLIYSGRDYELPKVPMVQAFDHVIIYLPALDAYADPTDSTSTLGGLGSSLMDKPVLRVSQRGATLARTPAGKAEDNVATIDTRITVGPDGKPDGETVINATGEEAQSLREFVGRTETGDQEAELQTLSRWYGIAGKVGMKAPSSADHTDPYLVKMNWTSDRPINLATKGWRPPAGLSPISTAPSHFFGPYDFSNRTYPIQCRPGRVTHQVTITLPEDIVLKSVPPRVEENTDIYSYVRQWSFEGHTLKIHTELISKTPHRVCSPKQIQEIVSEGDNNPNEYDPLLRFVHRSSQENQASLSRE